MSKLDLNPYWYRRLLVFWLFTGPPLLVLSNFHNPDWFSILPSPPPFGEGLYPTVSWTVMVLLIWHPLLLAPLALWSRARRHSKVENASSG